MTQSTAPGIAAELPVTPKHRRAPKGEKRREELLDAALQVFSLEGYSGASMAQVAGIVGISVAGLLHHFPSKQDLLGGIAGRILEAATPVEQAEHPTSD